MILDTQSVIDKLHEDVLEAIDNWASITMI